MELTLVEQFFDQSAYKAEIYVYSLGSSIIYGYDKYNGYINFYGKLEDMFNREFIECDDIDPFVISKDEYDNDEVFKELLTKHFLKQLKT